MNATDANDVSDEAELSRLRKFPDGLINLQMPSFMHRPKIIIDSYTVKSRFSSTIHSGMLLENQFVRKPNHIFPLQIIKKRLICSIHQKNNLFTWLYYTRGDQLFWPAGRIAVMEASSGPHLLRKALRGPQ